MKYDPRQYQIVLIHGRCLIDHQSYYQYIIIPSLWRRLPSLWRRRGYTVYPGLCFHPYNFSVTLFSATTCDMGFKLEQIFPVGISIWWGPISEKIDNNFCLPRILFIFHVSWLKVRYHYWAITHRFLKIFFQIYKGHTDIIRCISADPTGQWLVSGLYPYATNVFVFIWSVFTYFLFDLNLKLNIYEIKLTKFSQILS